MSGKTLTVAVVGHTNTGKTSLLRTLTRDVGFGEVSPHPATTRHVEGAAVMVEGRPVIELFDTPGLEDSIALLDHLNQQAGRRRAEGGIEQIRAFLDGPEATGRFAQEAKALRQVLGSDLALYVVDARDRVLGKHRDELEILARCATPVVPVLNFTADPDAKVASWREHLSRVNMHAVAEFDTVVLDEVSEQRLYEKMRTLLDAHAATMDTLIEDRRRLREALLHASAEIVADCLIDAAAFVLNVPVGDTAAEAKSLERLRESIRQREQACVDRLLELHRFRPEDCEPGALPTVDGRWGLDLFEPEALKQFGISAGGALAAGVAAGAAVDLMSGTATLGAGTAAGATIGALIGGGRRWGRRLLARARGQTELRCDEPALVLLAVRQIELVRALLRRGHAAVTPVKRAATGPLATLRRAGPKLPAALLHARQNAHWSRLGRPHAASTPGRQATQDAVTRAIAPMLGAVPGAEITLG
ncbi:MAG: GTPase/DUF3482 domain-containing protein [Planctomycetota bacterium]|jgi:GTPase Era involved in 16S rRNA processing